MHGDFFWVEPTSLKGHALLEQHCRLKFGVFHPRVSVSVSGRIPLSEKTTMGKCLYTLVWGTQPTLVQRGILTKTPLVSGHV